MKGRLFLITAILLYILSFAGCEERGAKGDKSKAVSSGNISKTYTPPRNSFIIKDIDNRKTVVKFDEGLVSVKRVIQPIVVFYIFTADCAPCRGVLPYLSMLQRKERNSIFVIGLLIGSRMSDSDLREFMKRYDATFFISNSTDNDKIVKRLVKEFSLPQNFPIPITAIYKRGRRVIDIEGAVPYEMVEAIIDDIKKEER